MVQNVGGIRISKGVCVSKGRLYLSMGCVDVPVFKSVFSYHSPYLVQTNARLKDLHTVHKLVPIDSSHCQ